MVHKTPLRLLLLASIVLSGLAEATIVRMDISWGGRPSEAVYIELYDTQAPVTVNNFLTYIDSGGVRRYDGSFLHRSVPGFIIQGGGYAYDPALGDFSVSSAPHIPVDGPIVNEYDPSRSNLRGTIAMAKLGGDPDSATSEWFFNLADNSGNLDSQNGGFTVFGRVLGDGMDVVDAIAALDRSGSDEFDGAFSALPLDRADPADPVTTSTLVVVERMVIDPPAQAYTDSAEIDFNIVPPGTTSANQVITIENRGVLPLALGNITQTNTTDFSVIDDQCSGQTLSAGTAVLSSCQITVQFHPTTVGAAVSSLTLPSNAPELVINLTGFGANATPTLVADPASAINFGNIVVADGSEQQVSIRNFGEGLLQLALPIASGTDANDVTILDNNACLESALDVGETCTFSVRLDAGASAAGETKSAVLNITAEPDAQAVQLTLSGSIIASGANLSLPGVNSIDIPYYETFIGTLPFANEGSEDLIFSTGSPAFSFTGTNASEFSITETTCERAPPNKQCTATLVITPLAPGTLTATLVIRTNDPDTPEATLDLSITASIDADGIPDSVEAAAPNGGDGNSDGVPDAEQENVASLLDPDGQYITVESEPGTRLANVGSTMIPSNVALPTASGGSLNFTGHLHSFTIEDVPVGGTAKAVLHLSENRANTYFKYNPNASLRWFRFDYNPRTGTGAVIDGNRITLHFVDGGRGDLDGAANGIIVDPGGPAILTPDDSTSSGGGGCSLSTVVDSNPQAPFDFILLLLGLLVFSGLRAQRDQLR